MVIEDLNNKIIGTKDVNSLLDTMIEITKEKNYPLTEQKGFETRFGLKGRHFSLGTGNKSIIIEAGRHGAEMIGIYNMMILMNRMVRGWDPFRGIDLSEYTFHFIPVANPECFEISSSAAKKINSK